MFRVILLILVALLIQSATSVQADINEIIDITTSKAGNIPFEHKVHLQKLENNCSACHNSIFHVARKKNPTYSMADMEKGKSCGACHKSTSSTNSVKLTDCTRCHPAGNIDIKIPGFGNLVFSHGKHLEMYTCTDCHDTLFRTTHDNPHFSMAQMERGKSCGACHDGKTAFSVKGDCVRCHQPPEVVLTGDSHFSHKLHLDMSFNCRDCHDKLFVSGVNRISRTMKDMEKGFSCGACHDGKTAFSVKADCLKCHKNVRDVSFKAFNARFSHMSHTTLVKCDDCHSALFTGGIHSVRYTMPQMEKGSSCGACHDGKTAFSVTGHCEKCHPGPMADINFKIKDAGSVSFSHTRHRSILACSDCHNALIGTGVSSKRYSMADMEKGRSCGACHDDETAFGVKKGCSACHPVKEVLFTDDARFSHDKHLEMYTCSDCHNKLFNAGKTNKRYTMSEMAQGGSCGACHDGKTAFTVLNDCEKCHKSTVTISFNVKETGITQFSHKNHGALYKCSDCHNSIFMPGKNSKRFRMAEMEQGNSCGACHDGTTAFSVKSNCTQCHPARKITFRPSGAVFNHNFHPGAYTCNDCHPSLFIPGTGNKHSTMAMMEQRQSCGSCHDGSTAFGVKANCNKCHPGTPPKIRYEQPPVTGNVEFNHKLHGDKGYNCSDCHYAVVASGAGTKRWAMKEMDQGKFCGTCHGFSMAFSVKDPLACERCHQKEENWRPQPIQ
ncbi:c(7)-type cytochrome triheme domain-containing protein [Pelotalea chapellei]|uniref:Cytochrome c3 family protein n=1 Tax=Pelotalea chapellei TaxID=44671 RepID=A0ABS5U7I8_9BACT|nr:cytochrome c3 family protein [Pelotalea chapellei]